MSLSPCSVCPYRNQPELHPWILRGDGPLSSNVLFLGEKPHRHEHNFKRPFVGDSGEDLNQHYLPLAGLDRSDVRVHNVVRCAGNFQNPEPWETAACSQHHIPGELAAMPNLEVLVLMGAHACSLVPGLRLELEHGIPSRHEIFGREYVVFPMYHPASGLHQTGMIREIRDDFIRLKQLLAGEWESLRTKDEHPDTDYQEWDGETIWPSNFMGLDTETDEGKPYCLTFSTQPGTGFLIWADDEEKLDAFRTVIVGWDRHPDFKFVIHYAMFDVPVLTAMGVPISWESIIDTMVMAYHRWLPQGLKTLAYRLCGMRMQDYEDLVEPYVEVELYEYLLRAAGELEGRAGWRAAAALAELAVWIDPEAEKNAGKMYQRVGADPYLAQVIGMPLPESEIKESGKNHRDIASWKRISRIVNDLHKGGDVKMKARWKKLPADMRLECRKVCGELPPDSIRMVPKELVLPYAVRDSDAALRVYYKMLEVGEKLTQEVSEEDWDNHEIETWSAAA